MSGYEDGNITVGKHNSARRRFTAQAEDEDKINVTANKYKTGNGSSILAGDAFAECSLPIRVLYKISLCFSYYWWWFLDIFIALFLNTTEERDIPGRVENYLSKTAVVFKGLFLVLALLILTPLAIASFLIWFPLQLCRPRAYSFYSGDEEGNEKQWLLFSDITPYQNISTRRDFSNSHSERVPKEMLTTSFIKKSYVLVSGNVCLMPECLARLNNVSNSVKRAEKISQLVCGNQLLGVKCPNYSNTAVKGTKPLDTEMLVKIASDASVNTGSIVSRYESESCYDDEVMSLDSSNETHSISSLQWSITSKERAVAESFPKSTDFLCLQEIFDRRAASVLLDGLKTKYRYVVYDVIWPLHHGRISILNSGLCIASKYPFLNIEFKAFPDGYREDKYACKGLLMTKVYLGDAEGGKKRVGYLATTHLQAITHTKASEVRCKQLKLMQQWLDDFKKSNTSNSQEVLFDIICGDFNFDQESHFEEGERKCRFRHVYHDPCMNEVTGQQHSWVIGTELIPQLIHDSAVNTSRGLQRMLVSELERPRYVASTAPANCSMPRTLDGRRRVDYILYKPCGTRKMVVKDYKFITGFATLTDHIPLSMTFAVED